MRYKFTATLSTLVTLLLLFAPAARADQMAGGVTLDAQSYYKSGKEALRMGDYASAESMFSQGLKMMKSSGSSSGQEALMRAGLGEALLWQNKLSQSQGELGKALGLVSKSKDSSTTEKASVLDAMAWLYQAQNKKDKAEDACRQALELRRAGGKTKELAESLEHLGNLYGAAGLNDPAAKLFEEAIAIRKETDGETSINYADDLDLLGALEHRLGHAERSQALFIQALSIKQNTHAVLSQYNAQPADDAVTFQFFEGSPNCARSSSGGELIQKIVANQVMVEARIASSPSDFVKATKADVRISNGSASPIEILQQQPELLTLSPKLEISHPLSSEQLAQTVEKKGERKAGWIRFWGQNATTTSTTTVMGSGNPYYGFMPSNFGYYPPCVGCIRPCRGCAPYNNGGMGIMTTSMPDWQARARAEQKAQQVTNRANADADSIRQNALGPATIAPGGSTGGSLNFPQTKFRKAILRVPVGNATFQFVFDLDKNT